MPLYEFKCLKGHVFDRFLKLANYNDPQVCSCGEQAVKQLAAPMFQVDFPAYQSPTSGKWITSRTQRREDLKASNCVEYEPSMVQEQEKRRAAEDAALDKKVEEHVEEEIYKMPTRQREQLETEVANLDINVVRV